MERQKTLAKWLAVILLLTLIVACYIALSAILGGKKTSDNVAGADSVGDQNGSKPAQDQNEGNEEIPAPHIPVYSVYPRASETVNGLTVAHLGGEKDEEFLKSMVYQSRQLIFFGSASEEFDARGRGIYVAEIDDRSVLSCARLTDGEEEFVDCVRTADGLVTVTRNADETVFRLLDKDLSSKNASFCAAYSSYRLTSASGTTRMYAASDSEIDAYSLSSTPRAYKSSHSMKVSNAKLCDSVATGTSDILFVQTSEGILILSYSTNTGFTQQNELLNREFVQVLPFSTDNEQTFVLVSVSNKGVHLDLLNKDGTSSYASFEIEGATSAAAIKNEGKLMVYSADKVYSFCSHLEFTSSEDFAPEVDAEEVFALAGSDDRLLASANGTSYLLTTEGKVLFSAKAERLCISRRDGETMAFFASQDPPYSSLGFGKKDVFAVRLGA